jgi:hypothetical protein
MATTYCIIEQVWFLMWIVFLIRTASQRDYLTGLLRYVSCGIWDKMVYPKSCLSFGSGVPACGGIAATKARIDLSQSGLFYISGARSTLED